jgi:antirestriction protein ArdC
MSVIHQFNGLGGAIASRETLDKIRLNAIKEGNHEVASRIANLLLTYPEAKEFELEVEEQIIEPIPDSFLHDLDFEESQDEVHGLGKSVSPTEVYDMITAKIINMVEAANAKDYVKKWNAKTYGTGYTVPFNFASKKRYRGVNVLMLTELETLENPFFLTFKQVKDLKGKVKKGAKGYEVVYFTKIWKTEDKPKDLKFSSYDKSKVESFAKENGIENDLGVIPMLKYYHVYNGVDIEGIDFGLDTFKIGFIDLEKPAESTNKMPIAEAIIRNYPKPQPTLKFGGDRAYYSPSRDAIQMPYLQDFDTVQDYYRTLLHEYSHSTGATNRLNRDFSGSQGSKKYAFEELVAELGAIFLSAECGIIWHNNQNHAAYLKGWNAVLTQLKEDNKFIMKASTAAQKVADFVLQFDAKGDPLYFEDLKKMKPVPEIIKVEKTKREPKKASNYGKKTKREPKPKTPQYPFSENDIPYETAYRAYTGISFSPEKRAVSEQKGYFSFMKSVYDENLIIATKNDKIELFKSNFEYFQKGYLKRSLDYLRSKHGIFSSMIAGPAKFPVARMEKLNRIANDKLNELVAFGEKAQKRLLQNISPEVDKPVRTGTTNALKILQDKLKEAELIHKRNLDGNKLYKKIRGNANATKEDLINGLTAIGFTKEEAIKEAAYFYKYSYAGFFTTNSNARVKRIKEQIALEEKLNVIKDNTGNIEYTFDGGTVLLNYDLNKIQIFYTEKPTEEERTKLKKAGNAFKWSPFNKAWQRQLNTYPLNRIKELLPSIDLKTAKKTVDTVLGYKKDSFSVPAKPKMSKEQLEKANPKPFEVKPESTATIAAIKDVLTLPKFKGINVQQAQILFKTFKDEVWEEDYPGFYIEKPIKTAYEISRMKTETNFHSYFDEKVTIWELGFDLVQVIKQRLESLEKQNNNYALFDGLKVPVTNDAETVFTNDDPEEISTPGEDTPHIEEKVEKVNLPLNRNSLAYRRQNRSTDVHEYYKIENPDVSEFFGQIEKKKKDSVAITIAGGQGSGKTSFVFQLINEFAKHYKVGHASIEEHPESALYENKAERFWNENAKSTVDSPEINSMEDIHNLILRNDVIVIDSFSKLLSMNNKITLDETFRKKYNGKLFIIIYQLTTDGKMRGGSSSQFDGDIILFVEKFADFADNYVYADKNRYQNRSLEDLHYNIASAKLIESQPEEEIKFSGEIERI